MPSGNPPVVGNSIDEFGTISFTAQPTDNPENRLVVRLTDNKRLEMTVKPGQNEQLVTLQLDREHWHMIIREID